MGLNSKEIVYPNRKSIVTEENDCIHFRRISDEIKSNWYYVNYKPPYPRFNEDFMKFINFCVNNCESPWSRSFSGFYFESEEDFLKALLAW